jgi:hypothetical protein
MSEIRKILNLYDKWHFILYFIILYLAVHYKYLKLSVTQN